MPATGIRHIGLAHRHVSSRCLAPVEVICSGSPADLRQECFEANVKKRRQVLQSHSRTGVKSANHASRPVDSYISPQAVPLAVPNYFITVMLPPMSSSAR